MHSESIYSGKKRDSRTELKKKQKHLNGRWRKWSQPRRQRMNKSRCWRETRTE